VSTRTRKALVGLGILSSRQLRQNRRVGYFVVAAIAVALPGVDPVTTCIEIAPRFAAARIRQHRP